MKFIVLLEDNPAADAGIRQDNMPAHLLFLEANASAIEAAGPLHTSGGDGAGGAWIVEAESVAAVDQLVKKDPFWPTGLRQSFRILKWTRVFADGERLINPR